MSNQWVYSQLTAEAIYIDDALTQVRTLFETTSREINSKVDSKLYYDPYWWHKSLPFVKKLKFKAKRLVSSSQLSQLSIIHASLIYTCQYLFLILSLTPACYFISSTTRSNVYLSSFMIICHELRSSVPFIHLKSWSNCDNNFLINVCLKKGLKKM